MTRRTGVMLFLLALATGPSLALAVGPSREVVQERLHDLGGRFDVSVVGGLQLNPKLIDQYGILVQPSFHFTDAWAFELSGGLVIAAPKTNLTDPIRGSVADNNLVAEFADMGTMQWIAHGAVRWSPIYGKLSLAAVIPVHITAYVSVGGGFVGISRESLVDCDPSSFQDTNGDSYPDVYNCRTDSSAEPSVGAALGLRLYVLDWLAIRAEFRGIVFPDHYTLDVENREAAAVDGLTSVMMFFGGASFLF